MTEYSATRPVPSLSLPIRMEQKRKRTRTGTAAIVIGVAALGSAGYNFTRDGFELIAIYLTIVSIGLIGVGYFLHAKAKAIC